MDFKLSPTIRYSPFAIRQAFLGYRSAHPGYG
jgi:hypothetical protein